jgi:anti-sigma regulatory factor (Ser/Thr protein kinase)
MASFDLPGAEARRAVTEHCRDRVPDDVIADLRLVVSELVANVLEHGGGAEGLTLDLTIRARDVDVQVTGHGDRRRLPPCDEWCLPPATKCSGRGLALVRRLARLVAVDGDDAVRERDGWIAVTASLPIA